MISMIAIALYSVVCSQCSTCGLSQQEDSLPELIVQIHTVSYRILGPNANICAKSAICNQPDAAPDTKF